MGDDAKLQGMQGNCQLRHFLVPWLLNVLAQRSGDVDTTHCPFEFNVLKLSVWGCGSGVAGGWSHGFVWSLGNMANIPVSKYSAYEESCALWGIRHTVPQVPNP